MYPYCANQRVWQHIHKKNTIFVSQLNPGEQAVNHGQVARNPFPEWCTGAGDSACRLCVLSAALNDILLNMSETDAAFHEHVERNILLAATFSIQYHHEVYQQKHSNNKQLVILRLITLNFKFIAMWEFSNMNE